MPRLFADRKPHYYVVAGKYGFPSDMLRYDDARIVALGTLPVINTPCYLIHGRCTPDRWASFVWVVFSARQRYPKWRAHPEWQVEVTPGSWKTTHFRQFIISDPEDDYADRAQWKAMRRN